MLGRDRDACLTFAVERIFEREKMSRIHDALKQAAEERASQSPASSSQTFVDVTEGITRSAQAENELDTASTNRSGKAGKQTFVDVTEGITRSAQAGNGLDTAPKNGSAKAGQQPFVRFEQLLNRCAHPKWTLDPRLRVFGGTDSKNIGADPFRTLRSPLSQIADPRLFKPVVMTSSVPAEGKTFVAANLAQSIIRQPDL